MSVKSTVNATWRIIAKQRKASGDDEGAAQALFNASASSKFPVARRDRKHAVPAEHALV